ncbi:MAG: hypothetical protein KZQ88_10890 [Candidatus Thiodiazotropha sp. (ex Dulcina madagascariensis)]|nr:hypothetical protein [Candidatus Thiodiazotropha sp. (ex Dulcina madagascariensis)]MCU7925135.1 hypothetical protein [Candidatus Thiodiazotropha sp. (ex Dulcina madagascariensis)]
MRLLGRLLLVALLMGLVYFFGWMTWKSEGYLEYAEQLSGNLSQTRPSIAYRLDGARWTEFPLTGHARMLRIVTNASINRPVPEAPEEGWLYALDFRLLDEAGRELESGEFFHRTRIRFYRSPSDGEIMNQNAFLKAERIPTDSRVHLMPLVESAARLLLRVQRMDPLLQAVMVRGYEPEQYSEHRLDAAWNRLTFSQRERIARGSVFGPELLVPQERRNLMRNRWNPLGPSGVQERDFQVRKLFVRQGDLGEPMDEEILPAGLYMDGWHRAIVHLPEGRSRVRLHFTPVRREQPPQQEPISVHWYGHSVDQRLQTTFHRTPDEASYSQVYDGGLLEIICDAPQVLRVYRESETAWEEITPASSYLRIYTLDKDRPVRYSLAHSALNATPFRLDLRAPIGAPGASGKDGYQARYLLLDADGKVLKQGELAFQPVPSLYDRLAGEDPGGRISEPVNFHFRLPRNVAAIEIRSQTPVWANAYTRPMELVRRVRVPEDYYRDPRETDFQPAWFVLAPDAEQQLVNGLRAAVLVVQRRPPSDDPDVIAGRYDWEEFRPQGRWRGRYLLIPRTSQLAIRDEALATLYHPLPSGVAVKLNLRPPFGQAVLRPTLIYLRTGRQQEKLSLFVDGEPFYQTSLAGSQGQIRLPSLEAGAHSLRLQSAPGTDWFINYADGGEQPRLRRFANKLEAGGMVFLYHKQTPLEEVLTGQFFSTGSAPRAGMRVKVEALERSLGPYREWSFTDRYYDLRISGEGKVPVLGTKSQQADSGVRFFLPLGEDLEPGRYRIRIQPEQGVEGYLSFYRLRPGESAKSHFFVERS